MRAFAPYRDWHALRLALAAKFPDGDVEQALTGWSCVLLHEDSSSLPRTIFISSQNRQFQTSQQVMKYLCTPDGQSLDHMKLIYEAPRSKSSETERGRFSDIFAPLESPFGLLEELFVDDPWRLLLSTILLNRTTRRQVDAVMHEFLQYWPDCRAVLRDCDCDGFASRMEVVLQPLGLNVRRTAGIVRFCRGYERAVLDASKDLGLDPDHAARSLTRDQVLSMYQCGQYAYSAYRLFIQGCVDFDPEDHALTFYAEYQRAQRESRHRKRPRS
jgi:endonuclease III